jgi:hypothetical protein
MIGRRLQSIVGTKNSNTSPGAPPMRSHLAHGWDEVATTCPQVLRRKPDAAQQLHHAAEDRVPRLRSVLPQPTGRGGYDLLMHVLADTIALVIGAYGAVVSTVVFAWTLHLHKRDASDIRLHAKIRTQLPWSSTGDSESETFELDNFYPNDVRNERPWHIEIHYANAGRRPATIVGWAAIRSRFNYPPEERFHNPVTLQESDTASFSLSTFDPFRKDTTGFVLKDSQGRSWNLPEDQLKLIQKLMIDHRL